MHITLIYFLKLLLLPPACLLLSALWGCYRHTTRTGLTLGLISLLLLWLLSLPITARWLAHYWEQYPSLSPAQITTFQPQAIVVLGGGASRNAAEYQSDYTPNERSLARLRYAAKLVRDTGLPLLISGGKVFADSEISEASIMAKMMREEFQQPVTWQEQHSHNTAENALFSADLLATQGIQRILLVTQAYHMPRAFHEFRKTGLKVLAAPTDFISNASETTLFGWLPSTKAWHYNFLLAHEMLGMIWYRSNSHYGDNTLIRFCRKVWMSELEFHNF